MNKYLIKWDAGFGPGYDVVEAESEEKATNYAYEAWKEEAESNAEYGVEAVNPTEEELEDYGL